MRIIARKQLRQFWQAKEYGDAEQPLKSWFREASRADWHSPSAVKAMYRNASIIAGGRVVFNIAGNKYWLVVKINYAYRVIYIRFIGTHEQYDRIDVKEI